MAKLSAKEEWKLWLSVAIIAVIAIGVLYFLSRPPTEGGEKLWRVERVIDGKTLTLRGSGDKIDMRLIGLDVPQSQAQAAKQFLTETLDKQWVRAKILREGADKVKEGFVYLSSVEINASIIRQGLAKVDQAEKDFDIRPYLELEQEAKTKARGVWSTQPSGSPTK